MSDFNDFQGDLKTLPAEAREKLKNEIKLRGFSFPLYVWEKDGTKFLLDGHQRLRALRALEEEGFVIPELPYDIVEAETIEQAKMKLLGAASQFGVVQGMGLADFIKEASLDPLDVSKSFSLPGIDFAKFNGKFFPELSSGGDDGDLGAGEKSTAPAAAKLPASHVRMVQLFFNEETHREFLDLTGRLESHYNKGNLTDVVLEAIRADFAVKFPNG